jgi:polynucleotide 5'-hydroxyl-kinase GRC3/NOL9
MLCYEPNTTPRILVTGAKRTGKSTFCRILMNHMLTSSANTTLTFPDGIMLLDMDPGQPELSAPGMVYLAHLREPLLGPSFANIIVPGTTDNQILRMHYMGAYTPRESPSHYRSCIRDLLSVSLQYKTIPLIINTCGWISVTGQRVLLSALHGFSVTDVVQIGDMPNGSLQSVLQSDTEAIRNAMTFVPTQRNKTPLKSGRDLREMQLQAYLHASGYLRGPASWDNLPITTLRATGSANSGITYEHFMIIMLDENIVPEYITDALDGSVAAIVKIKPNSPLYGAFAGDGEMQDNPSPGMHIAHTTDSHLPYLVHRGMGANPVDPEGTECLGLGFVTVARSVSRQLRIQSPVEASQIAAIVADGDRIALVLARQHGQWSILESSQARVQFPSIHHFAQAQQFAGLSSVSSEAYVDPEWDDFFAELARTRRPQL